MGSGGWHGLAAPHALALVQGSGGRPTRGTHQTMSTPTESTSLVPTHRPTSDAPFYVGLCLLGGLYFVLILAMLVADAAYTTPGDIWAALGKREIQYAIKLSLLSCCLTTIFSLWVAVPIGYLMSRFEFRGKALVDAILDIPIVLPPLVIGLSLLILFRTPIGQAVEKAIPFTFAIPGVILAQFMVACAFAVRTMRATFDQINPRQEQVALTLGCTRSQAFWWVVLPEARRGIVTAGTLAWARSLGEFGPILVFAGTMRMRTEVLPTSIYLEFTLSKIEPAVAVSLLMVAIALIVLIVVRVFGTESLPGRARLP